MTIHYTKGEEWANTLSHGVGILIGIAGGGYLLLTAMKSGNPWATGGMWLYLFGMLSSYISSTWYHASKPSPHREVLRKFDHASIYLHIAGSYSPIMLIALREADYWGWGILSFVWLCALAGIILCFCNLKEHSNLETICYIAMGCSIFVGFKPLCQHVPPVFIYWLIGEGVSYITGAVFYSFPPIALYALCFPSVCIRRNNLPYDGIVVHFITLPSSISYPFWKTFIYFLNRKFPKMLYLCSRPTR